MISYQIFPELTLNCPLPAYVAPPVAAAVNPVVDDDMPALGDIPNNLIAPASTQAVPGGSPDAVQSENNGGASDEGGGLGNEIQNTVQPTGGESRYPTRENRRPPAYLKDYDVNVSDEHVDQIHTNID